MSILQVLLSSVESIKCPFDERPSSCTVALYSYDGSTLAAASSTNVTLGLTTTVAAAAGLGQTNSRQLTVASTASIAFNETYRLKNAYSQYEFIKCLGVSGSLVYTDERLAYAYDSGDTFESTVVSRALTAAETIKAATNYRARFTATMTDSTVIAKDIIFDVVKSKLEQPLDESNIHLHLPLIVEQLPTNQRGSDWKDLLDRSFEAVYMDIVKQGVRPNLIMDQSVLVQLQKYKFLMFLCENGFKFTEEQYPFEAARYFDKRYMAAMDTVISKLQWVDQDEDLTPNASELSPLREGYYL